MSNLRKIKVLIVEDDPMVRSINESFLKKIQGTELQGSYGSIIEAKTAIINELPDLLLLDIFFPNEQGIELLKWLRNHNFQVDVIFITADNNANSIEEAKRFGAFDYLLKPFRFERLQEAIAKYIDMKEQLEITKTLNQKEVDHILDHDSAVFDVDTTFQPFDTQSNKTYAMIFQYLKEHPLSILTAKEVGLELGISRITARRYLEQMVDEKVVDVKPNYGSIGRPQNHYVFRRG